jgi:3-deoxy-7-phosphoheptulonate synthase
MEKTISPPANLSQNGQVAADMMTNASKPVKTPARWTPSSWTSKPVKQDAVYTDRKAVERSLAKLERLPPIVTPTEIIKLKRSLKDVALGKAFLLQGGDCAELFNYCEENAIESKIKLLLQMSLVLIWGSNKPVVRIARMAGQYAKPRSNPTEIVNGMEMPSFRGDILNGFDSEERSLDPSRLVRYALNDVSRARPLTTSIVPTSTLRAR